MSSSSTVSFPAWTARWRGRPSASSQSRAWPSACRARSPRSTPRATPSRSRSSRPQAVQRRRSKPTSSSSRSAAAPTPQGLGLEEAGVALDERGRVAVDDHFRTNVARHLRHRRRDPRADARPQGGGRGRRGRRDRRRPGGTRELRRHPERRLHPPGDRLGRQDRGGAEGGGCRVPRRQIPVLGQRPGPGDAAPRTASSRCSPTLPPTASSASTSSVPMPAS